MVDENYSKTAFAAIIIIFLMILAVFMLKPIIISIILAFLLAFIFSPVYNWFYKMTKSKNMSAIMVILILALIIIPPIWFFTPILIKQSFEFFLVINKIDFVKIFRSIFPTLFASEQFSTEVGLIVSSFTSNIANKMTNYLAKIILNFPTIMLHFTVILFTFFFVLRDKESLVEYIKNILPFSKEVVEKLFKYSKDVTSSLLYGQFIVGMIQGIIVGIGFFIFGVPNAFLLTLIAILVGVLPILGPFLVWLPVSIYLFSIQKEITLSLIGVVFFGIIASSIDNYLRPLIVSKRTKIHSGIVLISMIGGGFFFGVLGIILGPLIISYLLVFLEIYRGRQKPVFLIEPDSK